MCVYVCTKKTCTRVPNVCLNVCGMHLREGIGGPRNSNTVKQLYILVCVCVCVCVRIHVGKHLCTQAYVRVYAYMCVLTPLHSRVRVCVRMYVCASTSI